MTASDSASWDGSPFDAEAADEAAAIVGVVGESVGVSAGLLGEHVDVLDSAVRGASGAVVCEDFGCPAIDGASQAGELGDLGVGAVLQEHDESTAGVRGVNRGRPASIRARTTAAGEYASIALPTPVACAGSRPPVRDPMRMPEPPTIST